MQTDKQRREAEAYRKWAKEACELTRTDLLIDYSTEALTLLRGAKCAQPSLAPVTAKVVETIKGLHDALVRSRSQASYFAWDAFRETD
jgi:hypothetical protein